MSHRRSDEEFHPAMIMFLGFSMYEGKHPDSPERRGFALFFLRVLAYPFRLFMGGATRSGPLEKRRRTKSQEIMDLVEEIRNPEIDREMRKAMRYSARKAARRLK